jgi:hypothetical protein
MLQIFPLKFNLSVFTIKILQFQFHFSIELSSKKYNIQSLTVFKTTLQKPDFKMAAKCLQIFFVTIKTT